MTKASSYVKPDAIVIDDNRNDKDIITINRPKTAYKDNSGLDLYNKDIPVVFNIKDGKSHQLMVKKTIIQEELILIIQEK